MITKKEITGTAFIAITTAGQSGSCWLGHDDSDFEGTGDVRVYHADDGLPDVTKKAEGLRAYKPKGNGDVLLLSADNSSDIFYAICNDTDGKADLMVDVV